MKRIFALLVGLLVVGTADACSCSYVPLGTKEAQRARDVFVFQLMDAHVEAGTAGGPTNSVTGTVKILAHVRGRARVQQVHYSTSWCCGSRLEVGKYYIAFLSSDAPRFNGNASNILPLWQYFGPEEADRLEAVLRGKENLEEAFSYGLDEIHQTRPPPPPCPDQSKKAR